jgi:hypothetical protein
MKRLTVLAMTALFVAFMSGGLFAAANDTATINYSVSAINELNIDDATETFAISTATAGAQPDSDTAQTGSYDITTNCAANAKKITAALDLVMPTGTTLVMTLTAPTGASASAVTLSATPQDAATLIDGVAQANIAIGYTFSATVAAGVVTNTPKTLTLTLADS